MKKQGRTPLLIACDLQRPAAIEQLATLGRQIDVPVFTPDADEKNVERAAAEASSRAQISGYASVEIFDTAGRQEIDETLIEEMKGLKNS